MRALPVRIVSVAAITGRRPQSSQKPSIHGDRTPTDQLNIGGVALNLYADPVDSMRQAGV